MQINWTISNSEICPHEVKYSGTHTIDSKNISQIHFVATSIWSTHAKYARLNGRPDFCTWYLEQYVFDIEKNVTVQLFVNIVHLHPAVKTIVRHTGFT